MVILVNLDNIQALPMAAMADYHCHCDFSFDAVGTIDQYCQAALKRGLAELCFTTHFDYEPRPDGSLKDENFIRINGDLRPVSPDLLAPYVDTVRAAHEKFYAEGLAVRVGLEFGWFPDCEELVLTLKDRFDFDYFLCGVHNLNGVPIQETFGTLTLEDLTEQYFTNVLSAAQSGLFDCLAHLDYYKRDGLKFYGDKIRRVHEPFIGQVFEALNLTGTGIEVNTAALRHGHPDYYPGMAIINAARSAGVQMRHVGSDSHRPEDIGFDFEAVEAVVPPFVVGREG